MVRLFEWVAEPFFRCIAFLRHRFAGNATEKSLPIFCCLMMLVPISAVLWVAGLPLSAMSEGLFGLLVVVPMLAGGLAMVYAADLRQRRGSVPPAPSGTDWLLFSSLPVLGPIGLLMVG